MDELVVADHITTNLITVNGPWRVNQEIINSTVYITSNFSFRRYVTSDEMEKPKAMDDLLDDPECYNEKGSERLEFLLGHSGLFNNPKPVGVISYLIQATGASENDIILDFFAGSASTADSMLNDFPTSKFILVQIPEGIENDTFSTIAELGKERIRKVLYSIESERGKDQEKLTLFKDENPIR